MKRVEESILSRDYKKHIQVGGRTPGAFPAGISREVEVWATGKAKPSSRTGIRLDILLFTRDWKKQGSRVTGAGKQGSERRIWVSKCSGSGFREN